MPHREMRLAKLLADGSSNGEDDGVNCNSCSNVVARPGLLHLPYSGSNPKQQQPLAAAHVVCLTVVVRANILAELKQQLQIIVWGLG